ncbi:MAG: T9SS type A sorting domain-containing protein [Bacteroidia bacterium]|nr:T9SS type A sorting domain-containing protein [Bacteroidia bacterium]
MKIFTIKQTLLRNFAAIIVLQLFLVNSSFGVTITAKPTGGNWSDGNTWVGGISPGSSFSNRDVVINAGTNVTLDIDITVNINSSITVNGNLTGLANQITVNFGSVGGSGTFQIRFIDCGASTNINLLAGSNFTSDSIKVNGILTGAGTINTGFISCLGTIGLTAGTLTAGYIDCNALGDLTLSSGTTLTADSVLNIRHLIGSGTFNLGLLDCGTAADITLSPGAQLICDNIINRFNIINISDGSIQIKNQLDLVAGGINLTNNAFLTLTDTCWIFMRGGRIRNLSVNDITTNLNVRLSDNADTLSNDLKLGTGPGNFGSVEFNFSDPNHTIILGEDIIVSDRFDLSSGILDMANNDVTINGDFITGLGKLKGSINSGLAFGDSGILDTLNFVPGSELIGNLFVTRDSSLIMGTDLSVTNLLNFSGDRLILNHHNLSVNGGFLLDSAFIFADNTSNIILSGAGIFDTLKFDPAGGNVLNDFTLNMGDSTHVPLGGKLIIEGDLNLYNGSFDFPDGSLFVNGNFVCPTGTLSGGEHACLHFLGTGNVDSLRFEKGHGRLDTLIFSRSIPLNLASDLRVDSNFVFGGSELWLNGNELIVNGNFNLGDALIAGNDSSSLAFSGHGIIDTLEFVPGQNILNRFTVNMDTLKQVILGSDIQVKGTVFTTSGEIVLEGTTLTISGSITKNRGLFVGSTSASIVIEGIDTCGILAFKPGYDVLDSLVIDRQGPDINGIPSGIIGLEGDLTLNFLDIQSGMFNLAAEDTSAGKASNTKNVTVNSTTNMNGMVGVASSGPMKNLSRINLNLKGNIITSAQGKFAGANNFALNISQTGTMDTISFAQGREQLSEFIYARHQDVILGTRLIVKDSMHVSHSNITIKVLEIHKDLTLDSAFIEGNPLALLSFIGNGYIDTIKFTPTGNVLGKLLINRDTLLSVILDNNITVFDTLSLLSGNLDLQHNLRIDGFIESVTGMIKGSPAANIIVNGTGSAGILAFKPGFENLDSLIINRMGTEVNGLPSGVLNLSSDLTLNSLKLNTGMLNIIANGPVGKATNTKNVTVNNTTNMNGMVGVASSGPMKSLGMKINLNLNGDLITGTAGKFVGTDIFNIHIAGHGVTDTLNFAAGHDTLGALTFARDTISKLILGSSLTVSDSLHFESGDMVMNDFVTLTITGDLILDNAQLSPSQFANLVLLGSGNIDTLMFDPSACTISNFTVGVDSGHTVVLGCNLTVNGNLYMLNGELVLSLDTITLNGTMTNEDGTITGNATATMIIGGTDTLGILSFTPTGEVLNELVINRAGAKLNGIPSGLVGIGSNLTVNNIKILNGMLDVAPTGPPYKSGPPSNLTLNVNNTLNLVNGAIGNLSDTSSIPININVNNNFETTPNGQFAGSDALTLAFSGNGSMDTLSFIPNYENLSGLIYSNSSDLVLNGNLTLVDTFYFTSGNINIANSTLTINGDLVIDYAAFIGSPQANMIIASQGNIDTLIFLASTAEVNDLSVSVEPPNTVVIGCDLTVNGNLYAVNGEIVLDKDTLVVSGDFQADNGSISGSAEATLVIGGVNALTSNLTFTPNAQELKSLVIDRANSMIEMGSDLRVNTELALNNGKIDLGDYKLILDSLAEITGFDKDNYIVTSDTGRLYRFVNDTSGIVNFPVGTLSNYTPLFVRQNSVTEYGQFSVRVNPGVFAQGDTGANLAINNNIVNNTWDVSTDMTDYNFSMGVGWTQDMEQNDFNHDSCYVTHYNGVSWDTIPSDSAFQDTTGMWFIGRDSVTNCSPFAVVSGSPTECSITSTVTGTNITCYNADDGEATVTPSGGTEPYSYFWSNSGTAAVISNLPAGTYYVTITDGNNCTKIDFVLIEEPGAIVTTASGFTLLCYGDTLGIISATASGGTGTLSYSWSSGDNTSSVSNVGAGWYFITVTDGNACTVTDSAEVTQPGAISVTASATDISCYGLDDGIASVSATGGTGNLSYSWSNGGLAPNIFSLAPGMYYLTITDDNACLKLDSVLISEPELLVVTDTVTNASSSTSADGAINLTVTGGTLPYDFIWSNSSTTEDITGLIVGDYWYVVSDANGCHTTDTIYVDFNNIIGDITTVSVIKIYPNPTRGVLFIENVENTSIEISDILGRVIYRLDKALYFNCIDLGKFSKSNYFIKITKVDKFIIKKITLE